MVCITWYRRIPIEMSISSRAVAKPHLPAAYVLIMPLDWIVRMTAVGLIKFVYQPFFSPLLVWWRGKTCAHAAVYGGHGCSTFGAWALQKFPLPIALKLIRSRLDQCTQAVDSLFATGKIDCNITPSGGSCIRKP